MSFDVAKTISSVSGSNEKRLASYINHLKTAIRSNDIQCILYYIESVIKCEIDHSEGCYLIISPFVEGVIEVLIDEESELGEENVDLEGIENILKKIITTLTSLLRYDKYEDLDYSFALFKCYETLSSAYYDSEQYSKLANLYLNTPSHLYDSFFKYLETIVEVPKLFLQANEIDNYNFSLGQLISTFKKAKDKYEGEGVSLDNKIKWMSIYVKYNLTIAETSELLNNYDLAVQSYFSLYRIYNESNNSDYKMCFDLAAKYVCCMTHSLNRKKLLDNICSSVMFTRQPFQKIPTYLRSVELIDESDIQDEIDMLPSVVTNITESGSKISQIINQNNFIYYSKTHRFISFDKLSEVFRVPITQVNDMAVNYISTLGLRASIDQQRQSVIFADDGFSEKSQNNNLFLRDDALNKILKEVHDIYLLFEKGDTDNNEIGSIDINYSDDLSFLNFD